MGGSENCEFELVVCPECGATAEVLDRFTLGSTDGPFEMVKLWCVTGRWFTVPSPRVAAGMQEEAGRWSRNRTRR